MQLGRSDPAQHDSGRRECGVGHAERRKDSVVRETDRAEAAHATDDVAQQEEIDVAVDEARARRRCRHFFDGEGDGGIRSRPRLRQIDVGAQTRHVRQQMADRDVSLAVALEARNEGGDAVVQPILPSSISIITLVVVATTFVSDARSKIVSSVIGSAGGTTARWPIAL